MPDTEPKVLWIVREDDRPAVERFLEGRLAFSMFLLSNLRSAGLADHGERHQGTYIAQWRGEQVVGVAAHYRMGNLTLNAPEGAWAMARAALEQTGRPVAGLVGPADQVDEVTAGLRLDAHADTVHYDEREILFRLDLAQLVVPAALAQGTPRAPEAPGAPSQRRPRGPPSPQKPPGDKGSPGPPASADP